METTQTSETLGSSVRSTLNGRTNPPGKLADAELHFHDGVLDGLKLPISLP